MHKTRFKLIAAVYLMLVNDKKILLSRRFNTGYEDGKWSLVAGHLDGDESVTSGMIREAKEEAGIVLSSENLQVVHVMHRKSDDERIDIFLTAKRWSGQPKICEPEKCGGLEWFPLTKLPADTIPYIREAIQNYQNNICFSEFGWH